MAEDGSRAFEGEASNAYPWALAMSIKEVRPVCTHVPVPERRKRRVYSWRALLGR